MWGRQKPVFSERTQGTGLVDVGLKDVPLVVLDNFNDVWLSSSLYCLASGSQSMVSYTKSRNPRPGKRWFTITHSDRTSHVLFAYVKATTDTRSPLKRLRPTPIKCLNTSQGSKLSGPRTFPKWTVRCLLMWDEEDNMR